MNRKEFLKENGFNVGAGRPSREATLAIEKYRREVGPFDDDAKPKSVVAQSTGKSVSTDNVDSRLVRQWARSNNVAVGERGRIHPDVLAAYVAAHNGTAPVVAKTVSGKHIGKESPAMFPLDSKWTTVDGKYKVNGATCCTQCKCSLTYHRCANARIVARNGNGTVPVILVQSKEKMLD